MLFAELSPLRSLTLWLTNDLLWWNSPHDSIQQFWASSHQEQNKLEMKFYRESWCWRISILQKKREELVRQSSKNSVVLWLEIHWISACIGLGKGQLLFHINHYMVPLYQLYLWILVCWTFFLFKSGLLNFSAYIK